MRQKLLASTLLGAAMTAAPAYAQIGVGQQPGITTQPTPEQNAAVDPSAQPGDGEAIVVTGSRIQRRDLTSTSPISVVSSEEFKLSGAVNVEQVLNTLPQILPGSTGFSNNPGNGASTLNLRNLGTARTLVLVNGRRWMFYDTNQIVDVNTIPQFMLRNVEVISGGASAVYGSDAVAGVVNFTLRDDLNGIEMGGNYALTSRGDAARYSADLGMGTQFADGRGHVTMYANYTERRPIFGDARRGSATAAGDGCIVAGSRNSSTGLGTNFGGALATCVARGGEVGLIPQGSASTPIATLTNIGGANGSIFSQTGGNIRGFDNPGDLYNFAPDNYLQLPQKRYLIGAYGSYEIKEGLNFYTELSFVNNSVQLELAPTPIGQAVNLQVASPFFSAATRAQFAAIDARDAGALANNGYINTNVGFRFNQSGPRNSEQNRDAFRVLGGLRGDITPSLHYDAYYLYARTRNTQFQQGNIARSRFANALETSFAADGSLQCANAAARTAGCQPLNIFGLGLASQAALNYVAINSTNIEVSDLQNVVGSISGDLFSLGLGAPAIAFAAGGEYREMSSRYIPDTFLSSGDVAGFNAGQPTSGRYNVKEVFGELQVPILRDSFIHALDVTGKGRYSDYSLGNVGGVWTYGGGVNFAPVRDLSFRGEYQRSVRAPNVQDLFAGNSTGFPAAQDPCSSRFTGTRTDALRQLCIASGVPAANFNTVSVQPNTQIQANFGGNPNLSEETSDTWTAGVVFRPSFVPRLNVTVDYFDVTVKDAIATFAGGLNNALSLCYTVAQDLTNPICSVFAGQRNPATGALGETSGGRNPNILSANIGRLETKGIDVGADYSAPLGFSLLGNGSSRLNFNFAGTYLLRFRSTAVAAIPEQEVIGEGSISGGGTNNPLPRWRHNARVTYSDGPATVSVRWRHNGPVKDFRIENTFAGLTRTQVDPATLPNARIGAVNYVDLTFGFDATDNLSLNIGVNNLFDQKPPILGSLAEQANTYPGFYDVLGRDFFVGARLRF